MWDEKIKEYQVAWYDMDCSGKCIDEAFYSPEKINEVIKLVEIVKNKINNFLMFKKLYKQKRRITL